MERIEPSFQSKVNINLIAELLPCFRGGDMNLNRWERQLQLLKAMYELDDRFARVLIGSRLKGIAFEWLHTKAKFLEMSIEQLLSEMKYIICSVTANASKLVLRKELEERVWRRGRSFS